MLFRSDPVLQRPDRLDRARRPAQHPLRLVADRQHLLVAAPRGVLDGHHRGLIQDDALLADIDQRIGRPKIDGQVVLEQPQKSFQHAPVGNG